MNFILFLFFNFNFNFIFLLKKLNTRVQRTVITDTVENVVIVWTRIFFKLSKIFKKNRNHGIVSLRFIE